MKISSIHFVVNETKPDAHETYGRLSSALVRYGMVESASPAEADAIIALGGDGTILRAFRSCPGKPVAGFNFGAKKYKRVRQGFFFTLVFGSILLGIASVFVYYNAGFFIQSFRDDPNVITIGIPTLHAQCIGLFFVPFQVCSNMMFQSIGYKFNATFLSSLRNGLCFIPVLLLASIFLGLPGIQVSQAVADVLTCLACIPFTVSFFRKISRNAVE